MSLQRVIDFLLPREDHFYDYLERQAQVAKDSVPVLGRFMNGDKDHAGIRRDVTAFEKQGDGIVDAMLMALSKTFVTPIDREDLQRLSKKLDDVVDYVNMTARSIGIFAVEAPTPAMAELLAILGKCCDHLVQIVPLLRTKEYGKLIEECQNMHLLEKEGDKVFRGELSRMFHDPSVDAKDILRCREILDHLETAIDSCDRVAEELMSVAVKHA
jgi:hypothetical protein